MNTIFYKDYKVKELSYAEYKNLVKNLLTTDIDILNYIFNDLLEKNVEQNKKFTLYEKIELLFFIRSIILGEDIELLYKEKNYKTDVNKFIQSLNYPGDVIEIDGIEILLNGNFYVKNKLDEFVKNIKKVTIKDKVLDFSNLKFEEKKLILEQIDTINLFNVLDKFNEKLDEYYINFVDLKFNLFSGDILYLLKNIFYIDLQSLYDFEYDLLKHLNLNTNDFKNVSFTELKIYHNKLVDDAKEKESNNNDTGKTINPV